MSSLKVSLVLTFHDQVSSPLKKLTSTFDEIRTQLNSIRAAAQGLSLGGLGNATQKLRQAAGAAQLFSRALRGIGRGAQAAIGHVGRLAKGLGNISKRVGPIGALIGFGTLKETTQSYADFDAILRQIAIVEGRSGGGQAAALAAQLRPRFEQLALHTGQSSMDIAHAYKQIITTHVAPALADQMISAIAKGAAAYNLTVTDLQNIPFALNAGLGLRGDQMETALAQLHRATMLAHFNMANFDAALPGITAQLSMSGVRGLGAVATIAALLETAVKVVPAMQPQEASTDMHDFLSSISGATASARFGLLSRGFSAKNGRSSYKYVMAELKKAGITHGIDLGKLKLDAAAKGVGPIMAVLNWLHEKLLAIPKNITGRVRQQLGADVIGAFFQNQQTAAFARAILLHWDETKQNRATIASADTVSLTTNFITMTKSPVMQMKIMAEGIKQVSYALGQGFLPVIRAVNFGLLHLVHALNWANTNFPRTIAWVLGIAGGVIALVGAVGVLGFVWPAIAAGLGLIVGALSGIAAVIGVIGLPITAIVALIGVAAWQLYEHWGTLKRVFTNIAADLKKALTTIAHAIEAPFAWLEKKAGISDLPQVQAGKGPRTANANAGDPTGMSYLMPRLVPAPPAKVTVGVDPHNGQIKITHASPPSVMRVAPDMGMMLGAGLALSY